MPSPSGHSRLSLVIGGNIARHRRATHLSRRALADSTRIAEQDIAAFESGRERPTATELIRIANRLGIAISSMFDDADPAIAGLSTPGMDDERQDPSRDADSLQAAIDNVGDPRRRRLLLSLADEFTAESRTPRAPSDRIEVRMPSGVTLVVGPDVPRETLARVLSVLGAASGPED